MATFADLVHDFLADAVVDREEVDRFLDPDHPKWARFDSELGYVPHPSRVPDGIDGAISTYRYGSFGERLVINGAGQPCRINSYGDSFTQCHQVSDGETWQEHLAAHLGEPIRNFGVGGYGVYQAYRRLCRTEATEAGADHVLFNIYFDDHYRSLDSYRRLRVGQSWWEHHRPLATSMFHANPWVHVRFDAAGELVDRPNVCASEESLYNLCELDFLVETFGDDPVVEHLVGRRTGRYDFLDRHRDLAAALGVTLDLTGDDARARSAGSLYDACAFRASMILVDQMRTQLAHAGKRFLLLLSYPGDIVADACAGGTRPDAAFVRMLDDHDVDYLDSLAGHVADYAAFSITPRDYVRRHYESHYTPAGNQFFAFFVKPAIVRWLTPRPPAYPAGEGASAVDADRLA